MSTEQYDAFMVAAARRLVGIGYHVSLHLRSQPWGTAWELSVFMQGTHEALLLTPLAFDAGDGPDAIAHLKQRMRRGLEAAKERE